MTLSCLSSFSMIYFFNNCSSCFRWSSSRFLRKIYYFRRFSSFSLLTLSSIILAYLWSICICLMKYWYLFWTIFAFYSIYLSFGSISIAFPPWILSICYCTILWSCYGWDLFNVLGGRVRMPACLRFLVVAIFLEWFGGSYSYSYSLESM